MGSGILASPRDAKLAAVEALQHLFLHAEALLLAGEGAAPHLLGIAGARLADGISGLGVALHESRREPAEEADHVVEDEHLAVAMASRADADGRDGDALRGDARELRRHQLEHDAPA